MRILLILLLIAFISFTKHDQFKDWEISVDIQSDPPVEGVLRFENKIDTSLILHYVVYDIKVKDSVSIAWNIDNHYSPFINPDYRIETKKYYFVNLLLYSRGVINKNGKYNKRVRKLFEELKSYLEENTEKKITELF